MLRRLMLSAAGTLVCTLVLTGCGNPFHADDESDLTSAPKIGLCRDLRAADLESPTNTSPVVPCTEDHTAQTFITGTLPTTTGSAYGDSRHGAYVHAFCQKAFRAFLDADESQVLRSQLSWAWFRPSELGWDRGARWFRCDVVGGPADASRLRPLPEDAKGLFTDSEPDTWVTCALGTTVANSTKVPCTSKHTWRAVTTIKLGKADDPYPGDRIVQARSRDYCQDSVGGWLGYPSQYKFGYTWFREDRWAAGNRRSICWAKTAK